jgi:hypothetical protein
VAVLTASILGSCRSGGEQLCTLTWRFRRQRIVVRIEGFDYGGWRFEGSGYEGWRLGLKDPAAKDLP